VGGLVRGACTAGGPPTQVLVDSSAVKAHRSAAPIGLRALAIRAPACQVAPQTGCSLERNIMRAEANHMVDAIKQSLGLLRRHL
jgi:hypothetical protein